MDYEAAAERLGVEVATVRAVAEVESGRHGAFLPTGEPTILFERHIFSRLTHRKYDLSHTGISNRIPGGYGPDSTQHTRLQQAVALDREAALQSASWGRWQVMGFNWKSLGYKSLQEFINAMYRDEAGHLDSFLRFVEVNGLVGHLKNKNWAQFARRYNGPAYAKNNYHKKLAAAYAKHKGE